MSRLRRDMTVIKETAMMADRPVRMVPAAAGHRACGRLRAGPGLASDTHLSTRTKDNEPRMTKIKITAGPYTFYGKLEEDLAPKTCAVFKTLLPYKERIIHVRWSGEACWIPLGDLDLGLGFENNTSHPAPGQVIVYPGGVSETEFLIAYGGVCFASKAGQLSGNHFLTITEGLENIVALGKLTLWEGAQEIQFELAE
jgi:hypothetical protein